ncbi:type VII toxin-antitoxin system MntA family adenylyltransferase antitoxin [Pseudoalteromonas sp.]|uniref:type VII toxin-antitoxin system MntA family adenylyltransferase antitoxin n=1 Tax=Pseudoalteromonas sp. TaxID=53249 RepID=UPI00300267E1
MTSAIEQRIVTFLLKHIEGIKLIYLFGSHSKGTANNNSDIDIAIMSLQPLDNVLRFNIAQQLAIDLDTDIDLVDLNSASTVLQMQVISTGKKLFGESVFDITYAAQIYSMYGRLQEDRQEIINDFKNEYN